MRNILIFFLLIQTSTVMGEWKIEEKKIDYLIMKIRTCECVFLRNGKEYSSIEAEKHIRMKYQNALSSWFTPKKAQWTAHLFIENVASKSSISGKEYKLKLANGSIIDVSKWLFEKLKEYETK